MNDLQFIYKIDSSIFYRRERKKVVRYLGSKTLLLENILNLCNEYKNGFFCDPFGGIGTVGSFMKKNGFHVISSDVLQFPYFFQYSLIERSRDCDFLELKHYLGVKSLEDIEIILSNLKEDKGWLIQEYSQKRLFFSKENAYIIQGCINSIDLWYKKKLINDNERKVLLASLINSSDKVANTAGTYYAHLKQLDRRAAKKFKFSVLHCTKGPKSYSFNIDAEQVVKRGKCDVLYLDPPYNERNYAAYYHLPETIATGCVPIPKGKSGIYRANKYLSAFNKKDIATKAFEKIVRNASCKCIIFHYTDTGLIDMNDARDILSSVGDIVIDYYIDSKGYNTFCNSKKNLHHILKCYI